MAFVGILASEIGGVLGFLTIIFGSIICVFLTRSWDVKINKSSFNFKKIEKELDSALESETKESLTNWIKNKRSQTLDGWIVGEMRKTIKKWTKDERDKKARRLNRKKHK